MAKILRQVLLEHAVQSAGTIHIPPWLTLRVGRGIIREVLKSRSASCLLWRDMRVALTRDVLEPQVRDLMLCAAHTARDYEELIEFTYAFESEFGVGEHLLNEIRQQAYRMRLVCDR